jgi:endonuclease YncB( thermonuclease family)
VYKYKAKLLRVVDGDTVDAMIDLGFDTWVKKRVRLYGIDAPESRTKNLDEKAQGKAATKRLSELLASSVGDFFIQSHGVGKYGRCIGTLFIGECNINQQLLLEGHAEEYQ